MGKKKRRGVSIQVGLPGYAGDEWMRPALCEDALRLGRILAELTPGVSEVHGLVSLMEIQASRARPRVGPSGQAVLLLDQDRTQCMNTAVRRHGEPAAMILGTRCQFQV